MIKKYIFVVLFEQTSTNTLLNTKVKNDLRFYFYEQINFTFPSLKYENEFIL